MKKSFIICLIALVLLAFGGVIYHIYTTGNPPASPEPSINASQPKGDESNTSQKGTAPNTSKEDITPVSKISSGLKGRTVTTRGIVTGISNNNGTVHFKLKDIDSGSMINGIMFKKTANDNAGREKLLQQSAKDKLPVYINGEVDIYKGNLEIKLWKVYVQK